VGVRTSYLGLMPSEDFWVLHTILAGQLEPIAAPSLVKKKKSIGKEPAGVFH